MSSVKKAFRKNLRSTELLICRKTNVKEYMEDINIDDYYYNLPADKIAQYPVNERDMSNLLITRGDDLSKDIFRNLDNYLTPESLLVFNNTRVIHARILFQKNTGALIEVLCLEPLTPSDYELSFSSNEHVEWKCIIGNLKKWKSGIIRTSFYYKDREYCLTAEKLNPEGEVWRISFEWNCPWLSFGEVIEITGHLPLPPYINRMDETEDAYRYQTVYSRIQGSVAAPTAGLHFTDEVFSKLKNKGVKTVEITLHVGAGTFQPVKSNNIFDHNMHSEHFFVSARTIELLIENFGKIIPVGTTSVRTLESLYWLGVKILKDPVCNTSCLTLGQWEAYDLDCDVSVRRSLEALLNHLKVQHLSSIHASTSIMIIPGYDFKIINGIITNFHQPKSTLLLLISAWIGNKWKKIYSYALDNNFRFLSYGDCSLLIR